MFGSRAMDTYKQASDIDIALKGKKIDESLALKVKFDLDEETNLPFFFDVVAYSAVTSEDLKEQIKCRGKVLYRRDSRSVKLGDVVTFNPSEDISKDKVRKKVLMDDLPSFQRKISNYTKGIYKGGSKFRNGDTLLARITPYLENEKTAFVDILEKNEVGFGSTEFIVIRSKSNLTNKHFLFYLATSSYFRNFAIKSMTRSSGRQRVQTDEIKNLKVFLPSIEEQRRIAEVLSSLDDKIELLRRQNRTLEDMAQCLFRKWFIEDHEVNFKEKSLGDILSVKDGTTPSTKNPAYWNGKILWTTPKDLSRNKDMYLFDTVKKITKKGLKEISSGLLPAKTLLLSSRAPIGYLAFSVHPIAINQGYVAIIDDKGYSKEFIYLWLKSKMDYIKSYVDGSTFLEINKAVFKKLKINAPLKEKAEKFSHLAEPLFNKIFYNQVQIRTLTNLRDMLLPKLINGQVRLKHG